jgi:membrane protein DedA with SNARE-associated domain
VDAHATAVAVLEMLRSQPPWLALAIIGLIAGLEYVAPPVPGDTVAVAGGVLVAHGILGAPLLLAVVTLGSVLGALAAYGLGLLGGTRPGARRFVFRFVTEESFERIARSYRRWGRLVILANRFFPGVRTSFLFAAGLFRVRVTDVVVFGALSAALWNGLLIAAGYALGANLEEVIDLVADYGAVAWLALGLVVGAVVLRLLLRRRAAPGRAGGAHGGAAATPERDREVRS